MQRNWYLPISVDGFIFNPLNTNTEDTKPNTSAASQARKGAPMSNRLSMAHESFEDEVAHVWQEDRAGLVKTQKNAGVLAAKVPFTKDTPFQSKGRSTTCAGTGPAPNPWTCSRS